jgi:hypothetical protein
MDFPISTRLQQLYGKFGTASTSLESLLKCEHKYWSRKVQREVVPDHIPLAPYIHLMLPTIPHLFFSAVPLFLLQHFCFSSFHPSPS